MSSSIATAASGETTGAASGPSFGTGLATDAEICRALLREGSKSFHLASRLLPQRAREPATALYAFCRLADDAIDIEGGQGDAVASLAASLDRVYAGRPADDPVERALSAMVHEFAVPRAVLDGLIEGLAWDADGRCYETLSDLRAYAARVASTVGVASTLLMGVRSKVALARAADLGVAMQLTNIARDIGEDARAGRIYLPLSWMREAGIEPRAWLEDPRFDERLAGLVERLLAEAERLYERSIGGIALLPGDCRLGIHAARLIYREIGQELARRGHDSMSQRTVVPTRRKLRLMIEAGLASRRQGGGESDMPPLEETGFLIDAVEHSGMTAPARSSGAVASRLKLGERIGWTIELFTRLEEEGRHRQKTGRHPV